MTDQPAPTPPKVAVHMVPYWRCHVCGASHRLVPQNSITGVSLPSIELCGQCNNQTMVVEP